MTFFVCRLNFSVRKMATSEYIPNKSDSAGNISSLPSIPPHGFGGWFRASLLTALPVLLGDVLSLVVAFVIAYFVRVPLFARINSFFDIHRELGSAPVSIAYFVLFAVLYLFVARRYGLYGPTLKTRLAHELRMTAQACLVSGLLLGGLLFLIRNLFVSRTLLVLFIVSAIGVLFVARAVGRLRRRSLYEHGVFTRRIAIVGSGHLSLALYRHVRERVGLGYSVRGFILPRHARCVAGMQAAPVLGVVSELRTLARRHFIDEVVIADSFPQDEVIDLLAAARELKLDVRAIAGYYNDLAVNSSLESLGAFPVVSLHRTAPRVVALTVKRLVDIVCSFSALLVATPVMLAVALAIRMESDGPVIYRSDRIGRRGTVFPCFKFRTMVRDAEKHRKSLDALNERDGVLFKVTNDPRITRVGRFLRKYSLDELPQFFNVLRGEMSIVGPRPPLPHEVEQYKLEHMRRLEVLPGVTGLWQVEARRDGSFEKYIALDTAYVENWSFWLDLKILARTADVVLRGTGT